MACEQQVFFNVSVCHAAGVSQGVHMSQQPSLAQELLKQLQGTPMQEMSQQLGVNTQQIQSAVQL